MPDQPVPKPRTILCPYCGASSGDSARCPACGGRFDPLSRQATQNAMGPWFIRDPAAPFRPGCSFETLRGMVIRSKIGPDTIIRGPTTRQFWELARRTPGVANLLGLCHNCQRAVAPNDYSCKACGAVFTPETDRQHMGLSEVRLLPGHASPERIAIASYPEDQRAEPSADNGRNASVPAPSTAPRGGAVALLIAATIALGGAGGLWVSWPPDRLVAAAGEAEAPEPASVPVAASWDDVPLASDDSPAEAFAVISGGRSAAVDQAEEQAGQAVVLAEPEPVRRDQTSPEYTVPDLSDRLAGLEALRRLP